ncbi:MAG: hypothetical protein HZA31_06480 [Opitutae bacterium]|nr:hypothetical protein [Opitutae bacterium]
MKITNDSTNLRATASLSAQSVEPVTRADKKVSAAEKPRNSDAEFSTRYRALMQLLGVHASISRMVAELEMQPDI